VRSPGRVVLGVVVALRGLLVASGPPLARRLDLLVGAVPPPPSVPRDPGRLVFREVHEDTWPMRQIYKDLYRDPVDGVSAEVDGWRNDVDGSSHTDYFVLARTREAASDAIRAIQASDRFARLEPGEEIVFERVVPRPGAEDPRPFWRSYVVGPPVLDGSAVVAAEVIRDELSKRPEVLVTFSEDGGRAFAELTRRQLGRKIAMLVDGVVVSAPVIESVITRGTTILMGDGEDEQRDASDLVASLLGIAPAPDGPVSQPRRWAARGVVALLAGLLAWLLGFLVERASVAAPRVMRVRGARAGDILPPLLVTGGVLAAVDQLRYVLAAGVDLHAFELVARGRGDVEHLSIAALGITPVLAAFWLVELVAWLVPALRAIRRGTLAERAPLTAAVACLAILLAFVQATFVAQFLQSLDLPGVDKHMLAPDTLARVGFVASLVGGVVLHVVAADLITRHGVCNGWLALLGFGALHVDLEPARLGQLLLGAAVAIALTARRAPAPDGRRLPAAGLVPAALWPVLLFALSLPYLGGAMSAQALLLDRLPGPALQLALAAAVAILLSLRRGTPAPIAVASSIGFALLIAGAPLLLGGAGVVASPVLAGAVLGVALVEAASGLRRRRVAPGTVPLVALHDLERADDAIALLRDAGIAASSSGAAARALYRGLGGFVPVTIHVPADRVDEAASLLRLPPVRRSAPPPPCSAATGG